jgi:hypothetical protein
MSDKLIRAKGILDGAETLAEAARKAQDFADYLKELSGVYHLATVPVDDDYMFIKKERT